MGANSAYTPPITNSSPLFGSSIELNTFICFLLDLCASKQAAKQGGKLSRRHVFVVVFAALVVVLVTGIVHNVIYSLSFSFCSVLLNAMMHEPLFIDGKGEDEDDYYGGLSLLMLRVSARVQGTV